MRSLHRIWFFIPVLLFHFAIPISHSALADCNFAWRPGEGIPGVDGSVYTFTKWDPDGPGPLPTRLVVGGAFTLAGRVLANNVATWDGMNWQSLGTGVVGGGGAVYALTVFNGELVAGGSFTSAGGTTVNRIARWDGSNWLPMSTGFNNTVKALSNYQGQLVAGGEFLIAGGTSVNRIATWDGTSWQPLGGGLTGNTVPGPGVYALEVFDDELVAGGVFTTAGGISANSIAAWNGSNWRPFGAGVSGLTPNISTWPNVRSLTVYNGTLIAGGHFTNAGGQPAICIAQWNGASWRGMEPGIGCAGGCGVYSLTVQNGLLFAGGQFASAGQFYRTTLQVGTERRGKNWAREPAAAFHMCGRSPDTTANWWPVDNLAPRAARQPRA